VSDSDWGTTPTLTSDSQGNQLVTAANKNGIVYTWKRSDLELGHSDPNPPLWQDQIAIGGAGPTAGDGTIASGIFANGTLYYAGGHNELNGHGSGGSIGAYNPGTGAVEWVRQTEQPHRRGPGLCERRDRLRGGQHLRGDQRRQRPAPLLVPAAGCRIWSGLGGRSQFYVGDLNGAVYAFGLGTRQTPPADPNCPASLNPTNPGAGPVTCQDIRAPNVAGSETTSNGVLTVTASGAEITAPRTSSGSSPLLSPVTRSRACRSPLRAHRTPSPRPG